MPRCEKITTVGQCPNDAHGSGRFCTSHDLKGEATVVNQYRIACAQLRATAKRHSEGDQLKSLEGEIIILRSLVEARLNLIDNDAEMIAAMPVIKDFTQAIEKVVASCHAMDVKLANLLSKGSLVSLAQDWIEIMDKHIRPLAGTTPTEEQIDETLESIANDFVESIAAKENSK